MNHPIKDTTRNEIAEFQKRILQSQLESASATEKADQYANIKSLLDDGINLLTNLTNQIEKATAELNKNDNKSFKTFQTLTAYITELKTQLTTTTDSINKIKSFLKDPLTAANENQTKSEPSPLAKVGYSAPLSFCHGSQQAAARQKAEAAINPQVVPNNDTNQKEKR